MSIPVLNEIAAHKRQEVARAKSRCPLDEMKDKALSFKDTARGFARALGACPKPPAVIAEIKSQSPSAGIIRKDFDPVQIAMSYARHQAQALSVLTDEKFFGGHLDHLRAVRGAVSIPLLRKDFMLDDYQIYESRWYGADAVLLIAALLTPEEIASLSQTAAKLGMDAIIEVHDEADIQSLRRVDSAWVKLVGINNRDLKSMRVDLDTTRRLINELPRSCLVISESGIKTAEDLIRLRSLGARAVLMGEHLMRENDPGAALGEILKKSWSE